MSCIAGRTALCRCACSSTRHQPAAAPRRCSRTTPKRKALAASQPHSASASSAVHPPAPPRPAPRAHPIPSHPIPPARFAHRFTRARAHTRHRSGLTGRRRRARHFAFRLIAATVTLTDPQTTQCVHRPSAGAVRRSAARRAQSSSAPSASTSSCTSLQPRRSPLSRQLLQVNLASPSSVPRSTPQYGSQDVPRQGAVGSAACLA